MSETDWSHVSDILWGVFGAVLLFGFMRGWW